MLKKLSQEFLFLKMKYLAVTVKKYFLPTLAFLYIENIVNITLAYFLNPISLEDPIQRPLFYLGGKFFLIAFSTLLSCLIEEYVFRGILFKNMAKYYNVFFANIIVSSIFAVMHHTAHEIYPFMKVGSTFFMSLYFTFVFIENHHTVYSSFLVHALYNMLAISMKFCGPLIYVSISEETETIAYCMVSFVFLWVIYKGYRPLYRICKDNWNKKMMCPINV